MTRFDKSVTRDRIAELIRLYGTDSTVIICRKLKEDYDISIKYATVHKHITEIRNSHPKWREGLIRTVWVESEKQVYEDLTRLMVRIRQQATNASATGLANLSNAYCNLFMHRKFLMENGPVYDAVMEIEKIRTKYESEPMVEFNTK